MKPRRHGGVLVWKMLSGSNDKEKFKIRGSM